MSNIKKVDSNVNIQGTQSDSQQGGPASASGKETRTVGKNLKEALELYKAQKGEEMQLESFKTPFGKAMAKMEELIAETQKTPEFAELLKNEKLQVEAKNLVEKYENLIKSNPEALARLENELLAKEKSAERYVGPKTIGLFLLLMLLFGGLGKKREEPDVFPVLL